MINITSETINMIAVAELIKLGYTEDEAIDIVNAWAEGRGELPI